MSGNTEWTNNEASRSKVALTQLGYLEDKYVRHFCNHPLKRAPEINRGYYSRVVTIARVVRSFCRREGATAQVVNIGAGFDTLFWRIASDSENTFARFVDVDSNEVMEHKIKAIVENEELSSECGKLQHVSHEMFNSERYHAISQDATRPLQLIDKLVKKCQIDKSQPILFIFECVLLYWEEEARTSLLHTLNKTFPKCNFVVFDVVNTTDKFSHIMQDSLEDNNTPLLGTASTRTLSDWNQLFDKSGAKHVKSWLMSEVYEHLMDPNDKARIEKIEFVDEAEIKQQLLILFNHYVLVIASNHTEVAW